MLNKFVSPELILEDRIFTEGAEDINKRHGEERSEMEKRHRKEKDKKKEEIEQERSKLASR